LKIWEVAFDIIKANPFKGLGTGDVQFELNKKYLKKNYIRSFINNHDVHIINTCKQQ